MTDDAWSSFSKAVAPKTITCLDKLEGETVTVLAAGPMPNFETEPGTICEVIAEDNDIPQTSEGEVYRGPITQPLAVSEPDQIRDRLGQFVLDSEIVKENPALYHQIMDGMIVWRCEHRPDMMGFEYIASHPDFEAVRKGYLTPHYTLIWEAVSTEPGEVGQTKQVFRGFQKLK